MTSLHVGERREAIQYLLKSSEVSVFRNRIDELRNKVLKRSDKESRRNSAGVTTQMDRTMRFSLEPNRNLGAHQSSPSSRARNSEQQINGVELIEDKSSPFSDLNSYSKFRRSSSEPKQDNTHLTRTSGHRHHHRQVPASEDIDHMHPQVDVDLHHHLDLRRDLSSVTRCGFTKRF